MDNSKTLVIGGQSFNVGGTSAPRVGEFMTARFGIVIPAREKGVKGPTVKELVVAAGYSADDYKAANRDLAVLKQKHYTDSALITGAGAADATLRKSVRFSFRKKDNTCIGFTTTFRKEKSASASKDAQIAQLTALVASLNAKLALPVA